MAKRRGRTSASRNRARRGASGAAGGAGRPGGASPCARITRGAGVVLVPAAAKLEDALAVSHQLRGRRAAEADQEIGIGELDLPLDERAAGGGLLRRRRAVARRAPRDDVGDVDRLRGRGRSRRACGRAAGRSGRRRAGPGCPRRGRAPRRPSSPARSGLPSAKTSCVAVSRRLQPSKAASAPRSSSRVAAALASARAARAGRRRHSGGPRRRGRGEGRGGSPLERGGRAAARGGAKPGPARAVDRRSSSATSTPISPYQASEARRGRRDRGGIVTATSSAAIGEYGTESPSWRDHSSRGHGASCEDTRRRGSNVGLSRSSPATRPVRRLRHAQDSCRWRPCRFGSAAIDVVAAIGRRARAPAPATATVLTGQAAFGDWQQDKPGVRRLITPADLPAARSSPLGEQRARQRSRCRQDAKPIVPEGFNVELFADGLTQPRVIRVAPNGDVFVAESRRQPRPRLSHAADGTAQPAEDDVFADRLRLALRHRLLPGGPIREWVYVANSRQRRPLPYKSGDLKARGKPEVVVEQPADRRSLDPRHRVLAGRAADVRVGRLGLERSPRQVRARRRAASRVLRRRATGSARRGTRRQAAPPCSPSTRTARTARGLRDRHPQLLGHHHPAGDRASSGASTNERDELGDNLPPDYATRVERGRVLRLALVLHRQSRGPAPRQGERPDLAGKVTVPDVLLQAHSAPLGIAFYDGDDVSGGVPRRCVRHAARLVEPRRRAPATRWCASSMKDGKPTGEYEDFMTGFVLSDDAGLGPPGRRRRRQGRLAPRHRGRQRHHLAGDASEQGEFLGGMRGFSVQLPLVEGTLVRIGQLQCSALMPWFLPSPARWHGISPIC